MKKYQVTNQIRFFNRLMSILIRLGLAPTGMHLLSVRGRKSGRVYSTPVSLVEQDGQRWLVSPYGEVSWVHNARAAGHITLSRGGKLETVRIVEQGPEASAPVLKAYIAKEPITRPYFDAQPDSPLEAFVAEAERHPVFLLQNP
jgi:deazaflavin-dependent oxidoreductase (nitroreductase family)